MVGADLVSPHPIFVFDGYCVLCSTGASFIMRHDPAGKVRFLSAQSPLGTAVYAHFSLPLDASYLLITPEGTFTKTTGYFKLADILGGWFRLGKVFKLVPRAIRDIVYDWVATNRYRLFGKSEQCALLSADQRARLVKDDANLLAQLAPGAAAA
jgi:predicted DCC family thiol-disulfide oxidoreductase YuxK